MNGLTSKREVLVGGVVVAAIACLLGLLTAAGGGPGFLAQRRTIDVVFRDGQGIREGSAVRIAGIGAGRVVEIDPVESTGAPRARVPAIARRATRWLVLWPVAAALVAVCPPRSGRQRVPTRKGPAYGVPGPGKPGWA